MTEDLFTAAAERAALASGRPVSQERLRLLGLDAAPGGPLFAAVDALPQVRLGRCPGGATDCTGALAAEPSAEPLGPGVVAARCTRCGRGFLHATATA